MQEIWREKTERETEGFSRIYGYSKMRTHVHTYTPTPCTHSTVQQKGINTQYFIIIDTICKILPKNPAYVKYRNVHMMLVCVIRFI